MIASVATFLVKEKVYMYLFKTLPPNSIKNRINGSLLFFFFSFFQIFQDSEEPSARHPLLQDWFSLYSFFCSFFFFSFLKNFLTEK
jgi:hypothetical protein